MVNEACLPNNTYYPRMPDYTLYSGVQVCWSEHSDSSFAYGFMSLDNGLGTMTTSTVKGFVHTKAFYYQQKKTTLSLSFSYRYWLSKYNIFTM